MTTHSTAVTVGHGDSTASTGAKKKPHPMYHDEPARSEISTKRSHRGIAWNRPALSHVVNGAAEQVRAAIT